MAQKPVDEPSAERILARTPLVTVGSFSARVQDPWFRDSGPIQHPIFVFPRTSVVIHHEGSRPFAADSCRVTYYNVGQRYTRRPLDPRGDHCEWFSVRPQVLRDVLEDRDPGVRDREDVFAAMHGPSDPRTYAAQRMVVRHLLANGNADGPATREAACLEVEEAVLGVLERLVELLYDGRGSVGGRAQGRGGGDEIAERVRRFLVAHFSDPLTLDDIADAAGISVFHMCREFKRATGTTVHRHRNQLRLRHSLELVADPASDLTRVALQVGYSSHSHFTSAFRRAFAMTPSEFRKRATRRRLRNVAERLEA